MLKNNDTLFSNVKCTISVPQGLVLGPLLFCLYINNRPQHRHGMELQMYADDTVVYTHAKTPEQTAVKLKTAMERITQWLDQSGLSLNFGKRYVLSHQG